MKNHFQIILAVVMTSLVCGLAYSMSAIAFVGPPTTPPAGYGSLSTNSGNTLSVGTSTPATNSTFLIVGSTTNSSAYGLRVVDVNQNPLFSVRNDGAVTVSTSTVISGGSFSGTVSAGNISSGQFGSNTGGGNYIFPSNVSTSNLSVTSIGAALVLSAANGNFGAYGGASACAAGSAVTTISAAGASTCAAFSRVSTSTANTWTGIQTFKSPIVSSSTSVDAITANSCGASASVVGSNGIGRIVTGNNASSTCTITFGASFTNKPVCVVTSETTSSVGLKVVPAIGTLAVSTASSSAFKSNTIDYICIGQ